MSKGIRKYIEVPSYFPPRISWGSRNYAEAEKGPPDALLVKDRSLRNRIVARLIDGICARRKRLRTGLGTSSDTRTSRPHPVQLWPRRLGIVSIYETAALTFLHGSECMNSMAQRTCLKIHHFGYHVQVARMASQINIRSPSLELAVISAWCQGPCYWDRGTSPSASAGAC